VYVTRDVVRLYRKQETMLKAGSLAIIYSFPRPGKAIISATFVEPKTGMRIFARKIVERTSLVRVRHRFMRMNMNEHKSDIMKMFQQT